MNQIIRAFTPNALALSMVSPIFVILLCSAPASAGTDPSGDTTVSQIQNYVHTVTDMDKSIAFYRDAMGLAINAPPIGAAPTDRLSLRENLNVTTNTPGATFRPTYFRLPGHEDWGMELLQFGNIERNPVRPRPQDPGATVLILQVQDLDSLLNRMKGGGATVVTPGGAPVRVGGRTRAILLQDLDGMYIELDQTGTAPRKVSGSNILSARIGITVDDTPATVRFYRDLLGFTVDTPQAAGKTTGDLFNAPGAEIMVSTAKLPHTSFELRLLEFKHIEKHPIHPHMQDPGAPQFTIYFKDPEAAIKKFRSEGTAFLGTTTLWDPNGVIILVRAPFPFY